MKKTCEHLGRLGTHCCACMNRAECFNCSERARKKLTTAEEEAFHKMAWFIQILLTFK